MSELRLSLWENSKDFAREALERAIRAEEHPAEWKFAILSLVQAIELALKERLRREHSALVLANVDKPPRTVTLEHAIERLARVAGVVFSSSEVATIKAALKWRNEIVHFEINILVDECKPAFAGLLGFYSTFCTGELRKDVHQVLPEALLQEAIEIERYAAELVARAQQRMEDEGVDRRCIWGCRQCGYLTFVLREDEGLCYACGVQDGIAVCEYCNESVYADEIDQVYTGNYKGMDAWDLVCRRCRDERDEARARADEYWDYEAGGWGYRQ